MEQRLLDFIASVRKLSDIRNLDKRNPIVFEMDHPVNAVKYQIVGSIIEPSYLGMPIYTTWVVSDPNNRYYGKALKLRPLDWTNGAFEFEVAEGMTLTWTVIRDYDGIWEGGQYYDNGHGGGGGLTLEQIFAGFRANLGTLEIIGASTVAANGKEHYVVQYTPKGSTDPIQVNVPIVNTTPDDAVSIKGDNVVRTIGSPTLASIVLSATYYDFGFAVSAQKEVAVSAVQPAQLLSLTISGASSVFEGKTTTYQVNGTFDDGTSRIITNAVLSVDANGSISAQGVLTGGLVSVDSPAVLTATVGQVSATKTVTVKNIIVTGLAISGAATIVENTNSNYSTTASFNDGSSAAVSSVWGISGTVATIDATGKVSAAAVLVNTQVTLTATYVLDGVTVSANKTVTITDVAPVVRSKYGIGPAFVHSTDVEAFIKALQFTGGSSKATDFAIDAVGQDAYMWFAYPKSWGAATFLDFYSNFPGAWDGAGLPLLNVAQANANVVVCDINPVNVSLASVVTFVTADPAPNAAGATNDVQFNSTNGKVWKRTSTAWVASGQSDSVAALKSGDVWFNTKNTNYYVFNGTAFTYVGKADPSQYPPSTVMTPKDVLVDGAMWTVYRSDKPNNGLAAINRWIVS